MKKILKKLFVCICSLFAGFFAFSSEMVVSSGEVKPGEWNSNYHNTRNYSEQHNIPLVIFYAKDGCGYCKKMKEAVAKPDFVAWQAESGYAYCFIGDLNSQDHIDGRAFIKQGFEQLTDMPMMCVYWLKSDNTYIKQTFVGRSSTMPDQTGSTLQEQLINSIEYILEKTPKPVEKDIPEEWTKSRTIKMAAYNLDNIIGTVTVKAGKANSKTGIAKVQASFSNLSGKTKSLGTQSLNVKIQNTVTFKKNEYSLTLLFANASAEGELKVGENSYDVDVAGVGGQLGNKQMVFSYVNDVSAYNGYPIFTEWLPEYMTVTAKNTKFAIPRSGRVTYDKKTGKFKNSSAENPGGLTLKYKSSSGYISGYFYIYYQTGTKTFKKLKVPVSGYFVDGVGSGSATGKGYGPYAIEVK